MNPNSASEGEELYINVGSINLVFDFKNKNSKSWFLNNLSKNIVSRLQIKFAGETCTTITQGLCMRFTKTCGWLRASVYNDMPQYGIASEDLRKLISKDDSGANSGDVAKVSDGLMFATYGTKRKISSTLLTPWTATSNIFWPLHAKATDFMVKQSGQVVSGYALHSA